MPYMYIAPKLANRQTAELPPYMLQAVGNKSHGRFHRDRIFAEMSAGKVFPLVISLKVIKAGLDSVSFDAKGVIGVARPLILAKFNTPDITRAEFVEEFKFRYILPSMIEDEDPICIMESEGEPQVITDLAR